MQRCSGVEARGAAVPECGGGAEAPASLAAAVLSNFKGAGSRARRATRAVRSRLEDRRLPAQDSNPFRALLEARRGYHFAARVITRLLELFRKRGSVPLDGRDTESLPNKALIILFANEEANAFRAAEKRRAG